MKKERPRQQKKPAKSPADPSQRQFLRQQKALRWGAFYVYGLVAALALILGSLLALQRMPQERLALKAASQHFGQFHTSARRGSIFDRTGILLSSSVASYSVYVDPLETVSLDGPVDLLNASLGVDRQEMRQKLEDYCWARFAWVQRHLTRAEVERLWSAMQSPGAGPNARGIHLRKEQIRSYPQPGLAGQVLGFVSTDGRGLEGIEARYDTFLRGEEGEQAFLADAARRKALHPYLPVKKARDGMAIYLTIDSVIQRIVEDELDAVGRDYHPKCAWAIVTHPLTGGILAVASTPGFNPENKSEYVPSELIERTRNRAFADANEPGSTMKPLTVAAALNEGVVRMDTTLHCGNGVLRIGKRLLHDHHPYGNLSVKNILVKSSNVGAARIGLMLGRDRLYEYFRRLGFGQKPPLAFPGVAGGILRPKKSWKKGFSVPSISIGQEVCVTPLQMVMAYGAIANGGLLLKPRLVSKIVDPNEGKTYRNPAQVIRRVFRIKVVRNKLTPALVEVVARGTGRRAKIEGCKVAGKTGTAQKLLPDKSGYSHSAHLASFIAFAPADAPRLLVYLGVDEPQGPQYGGRVAAPAVKNIIVKALKYLELLPALEVAAK